MIDSNVSSKISEEEIFVPLMVRLKFPFFFEDKLDFPVFSSIAVIESNSNGCAVGSVEESSSLLHPIRRMNIDNV